MKCSANPEPPDAALRLFFALWPDPATRAALAALAAPLKGRRTRPDNLHVTLAFLGQRSPELLPALHAILAALPAPDFLLQIDQLGYFARRRIAWAGASLVPPELLALEERLRQALHSQGIDYDRHARFTPHVTLARDAEQPPGLPFSGIAWPIDRIALVQSCALPGGVRYRVLATRGAGGVAREMAS